MRPTPRKLALLMSVAGLGLSLGEAAHAKSEPGSAPNRWTPLGLHGEQELVDASPVDTDEGPASIPSGPLDIVLPTADVAPAAPTPSAEDRAAVALAMVLMAEPASADVARAAPEVSVVAPRWEFSEEFVRDFRDAPSPGASFTESRARVDVDVELPPPFRFVAADDRGGPGETAGPDRGSPGERVPSAHAATAEAPARPAPEPMAAVDFDLSAAADLDLSAAVDVDLDVAPASEPPPRREPVAALDLNLDLGIGLDLNLALGATVDLQLDRPPVFAVTTLKPATAAKSSRDPDADADRRELFRLLEVEPPAVPATPVVVAMPFEVAPVVAATPIEAPAVAAAPTPAARIIVASHAERVMRNLEVLLGSDDPAAAVLNAPAEEIFVTSHAERALVTLASTCAREPGELATSGLIGPVDADAPASARPTAAAATECKPARPAATRSARRSALGDSVVAMSEKTLDRVRGGFDTPSGLRISFGIERAVYVNGSLMTTTSLNVSDLGKVAGGQGAVSSAVAGSGNLTLIQNGPGNTFVAGPVSAGAVGTVIQNTLNDQKIQSVTSINATVNSLQTVRAQSFQSTLRGALIDSLRR